jgi:hypothetical protein
MPHLMAGLLSRVTCCREVKILMRLPDGNISAAHLTFLYNRPVRTRFIAFVAVGNNSTLSLP